MTQEDWTPDASRRAAAWRWVLKFIRSYVRFLLALMALAAVAFALGSKSSRIVFEPSSDMVGVWRGHGRIQSDWTSEQALPIEIAILPEGRVIGRIGLARIVTSSLSRDPARIARTHINEIEMDLSLDGPLLGDGLARRGFSLRFHVDHERGMIHGTAASDGMFQIPGTDRAWRRQATRLRVIDVQLLHVWSPEENSDSDSVEAPASTDTSTPNSAATEAEHKP